MNETLSKGDTERDTISQKMKASTTLPTVRCDFRVVGGGEGKEADAETVRSTCRVAEKRR